MVRSGQATSLFTYEKRTLRKQRICVDMFWKCTSFLQYNIHKIELVQFPFTLSQMAKLSIPSETHRFPYEGILQNDRCWPWWLRARSGKINSHQSHMKRACFKQKNIDVHGSILEKWNNCIFVQFITQPSLPSDFVLSKQKFVMDAKPNGCQTTTGWCSDRYPIVVMLIYVKLHLCRCLVLLCNNGCGLPSQKHM